MTPQVHAFVMQCILNHIHPREMGALVVELGSRDINGSLREVFANSTYVGVDKRQGPNVDLVADITTWMDDGIAHQLEPYKGRATVVVCTEVLEHVPRAKRVIYTAWQLLCPGGFFILTCPTQGPTGGWPPHSGIDGEDLRPREWYSNPTPQLVAGWLWNFTHYTMEANLRDYTLHVLATR